MARLRNWMAEARRLEAAGDLQAAIAIFRKTLVSQAETTGFADLGAQNGLGDLYLRVGRTDEAIEAYEEAAAQCEEQQLYANGIAVCKKILRNAPEHAPTYRRVARLSALSGLEAEARRHLSRYRELVADPELELEVLREIVELTGDEESSFELADLLIAAGRGREALDTLRAVRDRREREGRGVVPLLRRIQELQGQIEPDRPHLEAAVEEPPAEEPPAAREPPSTDAEGPSPQDPAELHELAEGLRAVLAGERGRERLETALEILDRMLRIAPDRFELLSRKLQIAYELRDEPAVIRAFLGLGECLDRELDAFRVRLLSSSDEAGAVTAAIGVEGPGEAARGS